MTKVFVITGATSGIGRAAALALARPDAALVLVGRNSRRGSEVVARIHRRMPNARARVYRGGPFCAGRCPAIGGDHSREFDHVDALINNAGARFDTYGATKDGFERTFATNHLGHFLLTCQLLDHLRAAPSARIITVSSSAHRAAKPDGIWSYKAHEYDRRPGLRQIQIGQYSFCV